MKSQIANAGRIEYAEIKAIMKKRKPILCLDFDGVIHSYVSGWKGPRCIPDPPVPGALDFMCDAMIYGWKVVIHSSRARYIGGRWAMKKWLQLHAGNQWDTMGASLCDVKFSRWKPPAVITIDDRGFMFNGTFPPLEEIKAFQPWNKRDKRREEIMKS
jgi:hypothetical protein